MILDPLYHWSPSSRFESIRRDGLRPGSEPNVASARLQYVCFAPTPSGAWGLSGAMDWASEIELWDLWQARFVEGDEMHVRPDLGPLVLEVKVRTVIPPDRLWWCGRRDSLGVPSEAPR